MGSGDACVALAGGEGARGTATRATQASPPHASSTPAPTGQRGFFLLNLTPMGCNSLRPVGWIASPGGRNELRPYAPLASFPVYPSLYLKCIAHKERPNDDLLAFMKEQRCTCWRIT